MLKQEETEYERDRRRLKHSLAIAEKRLNDVEKTLNEYKQMTGQNIGEQVVDAAIGRGLDFMQFGVNLFLIGIPFALLFGTIYVLFFE